jgi:hypothetical protein
MTSARSPPPREFALPHPEPEHGVEAFFKCLAMHVGTSAATIDGYTTKVTPPRKKILDRWHEAQPNGQKSSHVSKRETRSA